MIEQSIMTQIYVAWSIAGASVVALVAYFSVDRHFNKKIKELVQKMMLIVKLQEDALNKLFPQVPKEEASKISKQLEEDILKVRAL